MKNQPHIVALLINMVPYHHARWEAFAASAGFRCTVLELAGRDEFAVLEQGASRSTTYQRQTLYRESIGGSIPNAEVAAAMDKVLSELKPDVICVNGYSSNQSLVALRWASAHGVPVIVCSESNRFDTPRNRIKEWIKQRVVRLCSAGLAGGSPQAEYLVELGVNPENVFTGYDVVENDHFASGAEAARQRGEALRRERNLPENYFIACSRFTEKKNIPRLIEAFALYRKQTPPERKSWDLVIVGEGELRPEIESTIRQLGVSDSVHLVGAKPYDELPIYYGLAGAFVHASTTEQWGLVVNEAMASGLLVVVSNRCGCATDLVREAGNGFTFDPYQVGLLAELMGRVAAPDFPLAQFSAKSCEIIAAMGPQRFAQGMKSAAESALRSGAKPAGFLGRLLLGRLIHR